LAGPVCFADEAALPADFWEQWLEEVQVLLAPAERQAFEGLATDDQRWAFRRAFWLARDPAPITPQNEWLDRWADRVAYALEEFERLSEEGAQLVLALGRPSVVDRLPCGDLRIRFLQWKVDDQVIGGLFVSESEGPWQRSTLSRAMMMLYARRCTTLATRMGYLPPVLPEDEEIVARADLPVATAGWLAHLGGGDSLSAAELELGFEGSYAEGAALRLAIRLPRPDSFDRAAAERRIPTLLLTGDVFSAAGRTPLRKRFFVSAEGQGTDVELVMNRLVGPPGEAVLVVELAEEGGGVLYRGVHEIVVPGPEPGRRELRDRPPILTSNVAQLVAAPRLRLRPFTGTVVGSMPVEVDVAGSGVAVVSVRLDDNEVALLRSAPYVANVHFGTAPRRRLLEAFGLDAEGRPIARVAQEIDVAEGPFGVVVQLSGGRGEGALEVEAIVLGLPPEQIERVEIFAADELVAELVETPYTADLEPGREPTYVRAVAWSEEGQSQEAVALVNVPGEVEAVEVEVVELYASILDRGGSVVRGLGPEDFTVREDGTVQQILQVEAVDSLALDVAVLMDRSGSMREGVGEARESALRFFRTMLREGDEAAFFSFNHEPRLVVPLTADVTQLEEGLESVNTWGGTALWDTIGLALHYLQDSPDRRAVVVLTDGLDEDSQTRYTDLLASAIRSGTTVFIISIVTAGGEASPRVLERLAASTGGALFRVKTLRRLDEVYERIREQLLSQYRIAYQSTGQGPRFRSVAVATKRPNLVVRTMRGYFP
jgi:VWFA-related protein